MTDLETLSISLLKDGYSQTYIDIFKLSKTQPLTGDRSLKSVTDKLSRGEQSRISGEVKTCVCLYLEVLYDVANTDPDFTVELAARTAEFARSISLIDEEVTAYVWLGRGHVSSKDYKQAYTSFKTGLSKASHTRVTEKQRLIIADEFIKVCWLLSDCSADPSDSTHLAQEALEASQHNPTMRSECQYHLGLSHMKAQDISHAIECQDKFLAAALESQNKDQQSRARAALAEIFEVKKEFEEACHQLELLLAVAENDEAQANACKKLGNLYFSRFQDSKTKEDLEISQSQAAKLKTRKSEIIAEQAIIREESAKLNETQEQLKQRLIKSAYERYDREQEEAFGLKLPGEEPLKHLNKAVELMTKSYELTVKFGSRSQIQDAAVSLAKVKFHLVWPYYSHAMKYDVPKLLNWKLHRAPLHQ